MRDHLETHIEHPPEFGEVGFSVSVAPVSGQAAAAKRHDLAEAIRARTRHTRYLLSGDVQIEIEWLVHEKERYESDFSPDVDNILKPLLDAICGPDGLLIDDCQVQAVTCSWIDWTRPDHQLNFRIRFLHDEWIRKEGLVFVHIASNLCFPMDATLPAEVALGMLDMVEKMLEAKTGIERLTGDYYASRYIMPIQRFFHRSRLRDFSVVDAAAFRYRLGTAS